MLSPSMSRLPRVRVHRKEATRSRAAVRELVQGLDPQLDLESATGGAAILLIAGLQMEHNIVKLARFAGVESEFVARCARRLTDNGVWRGNETWCAWSAGEKRQTAFWWDVAVAEGKLCRRTCEDGRVEWAPPGQWWKSFDHAAKPSPEGGTLYHSPELPPEAAPPPPPESVARHEHKPAPAPDRSELFPGAVWL